MSIAIVLGTRPEIIKMAPVIRECRRRKLDYFILHTGQHYSYEMDHIFFEQLELPHADYNLDIGSGSHGEQTGRIMAGIEKVLIIAEPDVVLVQGDTNTVLAGALAASKLQIKIGHVEAGLRSYDRRMPEEINRIVVDHISDYLFAPTMDSLNKLLKEGIPDTRICITGNTIVDSIYQNRAIAEKRVNILKELGLMPNEYILATIHRAENVDDEFKLNEIIKGLELVSRELDLPVVFPMHPRTRKMLSIFAIKYDRLKAIDPIGFLEFLQLESSARLILTDSGGVQEEACVLGVPCVTLRDSTERPETINIMSNILAGSNSEKILESTKIMYSANYKWINPFGDGLGSHRILDAIECNV